MLKYKGISPVINKPESDYNHILTNIISNIKERELLLEELNKIKVNSKMKISLFEIDDITIDLKYENFNYDYCIRKLLPVNLQDIPSSYELIGKIAHMNLREEYLPYRKIIGKILIDVKTFLIKKNPAVKTVVNKLSRIDNVYRTYEMELLAGEDNYLTNHVNCH